VRGVTAGAITMPSAFVAVFFAASVTWTVRLEVAAVVGVPVIAPVDALRDRPAGRVPAESAQV
jgi:hypothetical protein